MMNHVQIYCSTPALFYLFLLLLPAGNTSQAASNNVIHSKLSSYRPMRLCRKHDVCRTSLKYKDGTIADEGLLCKCADEDDVNNDGESEKCPSEWTEMDRRTLTWQHYERAHWYVQYRFCTELFNLEHECNKDFDKENKPKNKEENELAALVETDVKNWQPHVSHPRCTCPGGESYKLMGWKRESGMWQYFYRCKKPECTDPNNGPPENVVCAKIYIDPYRKSDMVNEMQFPCNCPQDYLCDAKFDEREDVQPKDIRSDDNGKYVVKKCDQIVKKKSN